MKKLTSFNVFYVIALLLLVWTIINWIVAFAPGLGTGSEYDYPLSLRPFVPIDQLFPNPDNDPDGPYFFGTFVLPIVAFLFWILGYISKRFHTKR